MSNYVYLWETHMSNYVYLWYIYIHLWRIHVYMYTYIHKKYVSRYTRCLSRYDIHMCHTLICTYICVIRCIYVSYAHTYASYLDRLSSSNDNLDAIDGLTSYYAAQLLPRRMLLRAPALQPQTDAPSFFPPFPCRKIWHHSRAATSAADLLSHLWFPTPSETCRPGCRRHAARPRTRAAGGHARAVAVEACRTWRGAWRSVGSR